MKKKICLSCLIALLLFTTGCKKEKKLVCNKTNTNTKMTLNFIYKGDELDNMGMVYTLDTSKLDDDVVKESRKQDYCAMFASSMGQFGEAFKNCKQKNNSKNIELTSEFDIEKLKSDEVDSKSIDNTKQRLEKAKFECSIE